MKNTKAKIVLSAIVFLSVIGIAGTVAAASSSLYVSPASLTKTVGDIFNASVGVNASGSKVCAAEGTLVFNNLSCQSITVAGDVTPQSVPTCSNPYFLVGIQGCTTANKTLFTISAKAGSAGTASIGFTAVDIIGEGVSLGSASASGNYTINAVSAPTSTPKVSAAPKSTPKSSPVGTTSPIPTLSIEPTPSEQPSVLYPTPTPSSQAISSEEQSPKQSLFLASIGSIITLGTGSIWISFLMGILIIVIVGATVYYFKRKERK